MRPVDLPLTLEEVEQYLEQFTAGAPVPQAILSEVLRQTQFYLESDEISLVTKARLQKLELLVLDSYHPATDQEARLLISFVRQDREGDPANAISVGVLVKSVEAVIDLMTEVAKISDLTFIPSYDLTALQAGGLSVEICSLDLDYYQPPLQPTDPVPYISLVQRVGEIFQILAQGNPLDRSALHHLLSPRARRSINQLVRLLRSEGTSDLKAIHLTLAQGNERVSCAALTEANREHFYFPEAPEWQQMTVEGVLSRREQDLDERKNAIVLQGRDGVAYSCKKFADRILQDHLCHLMLGSKIRLTARVKFTYDDTLAVRRADCRVLSVLLPPLPAQQIALFE